MNKIKKLQEQMDKHYKFIDNLVNMYYKKDKDKVIFYNHLNEIIEINLELEKFCNE